VRSVRSATMRLPKVPLPSWTSSHRVGMAMIVAATVATVLIAFSGPSAVTLKLGPRTDFMPPWYLPVSWISLGEWVVVPALWVMLLIGAIGLWISWRAVNDGWRPNNRKLFALGTGLSLASCLVPPLTSADVLMYAAYGRLQVLGLNPYDITPAEIFRQSYDPVLIWTERPWQDTPSVYGPVASFSQYLASVLGGESMHNTVFWLQMLAVIPFLITGAIVVKLAHSDPKLQTRAVLFTVLNPLMIWGVLVGAHNEALSVVFAIAGLWFFRKHPFVAGIGIGLAGTVKVSMVFYGLAMVWGYRRDWRRLLQMCAGAAIPLVLAYGLWMPNALLAAQRNTGYISPGNWGLWALLGLAPLIGDAAARRAVGAAGWIGLLVIGWMLSRVLPWRLVPGDPQDEDPRRDPLTITVRTAVVICAAWLITTPWSFTWYDLIAWAPLGLLWASRLDVIMIWRGAWLSIAWVTGRALQFGPEMHAVERFLREQVNVAAQFGVLVAVIWWWWSWGHELPRIPRLSELKLPKRRAAPQSPVGVASG
jgi:alpha-1,6-mannosyltransferase